MIHVRIRAPNARAAYGALYLRGVDQSVRMAENGEFHAMMPDRHLPAIRDWFLSATPDPTGSELVAYWDGLTPSHHHDEPATRDETTEVG